MFKLAKLDNGLTIATAEMPHMSSVSVGIWIGVGSRHETIKFNGITHFIEHLLFKGTKTRSAKNIHDAIEGAGGQINAFTSEENMCIYSKAHSECLPEILDTIMDMYVNSLFDPVEIAKERNIIKDEILMCLDQPQNYVQELLNQTLWPNQPLGRPVIGTMEALDRINRSHIVEYHKRHYIASSTMITIAGKLKHERCLKAGAKYWANISPGKNVGFPVTISRQTEPVMHIHTKNVEQTQIALGIRTCSRHDKHRYALSLLNTILGENMGSRLFQSVREEHGAAYYIFSSLNFYQDTGSLVISAGVDTQRLEEALNLIIHELKRLSNETPQLVEVEKAKKYAVGQIDMDLESTESRMMWMGEHLIGYGEIFLPEEIKNQLSRVRPKDIQTVARHFFRRERLNLSLITPLRKRLDSSVLLKW